MTSSATRLLYLQQAPVQIVLDAYCAQPEWSSEASQDALWRVLSCAAAQRLSVRYRQRVIKAVVSALAKLHDVELNEALLDAHASAPAGASADADEWTTRTFEPAAGCEVCVRCTDSFGGGAETGCKLWPAALLLSAWLMETRAELAGLRVLELGAGPGLPGLSVAAAAEPSRVFLTDFNPPTLSNLQHNVSLLPASAAGRVRVGSLDWYAPNDGLVGMGEGCEGCGLADLVLAADCIYAPELVQPLVRTLRALLGGDTGGDAATRPPSPRRALVASERRSEETWQLFEAALTTHAFEVHDLSARAACAAASRSCGPFWLPADQLERVVLLELRAPGAAGEND